MRIRILIFVFWMASNCCSGQSYEDTLKLKEKLILTKSQNNEWLDSLKNNSTSQKLDLIIERLMLDSNVYVMQRGDRIKIDRKFQSSKFMGCCKPIIILNGIIMNFGFEDEASYHQTQNEIEKFKQATNKIVIAEIEILSQKVSDALFGPDGQDGVIVLNITDRKSRKLLKKIYTGSK